MDQTCYPSKSWVFINHFFFKVRQHSQQQLYVLNTEYAEFTTKCYVLLHFHNFVRAYRHPYNLQQKSVPLLQSIFTSLFHPYLYQKSFLKSPLTLPSSIPQQFFTSQQSTTKNIFHTSAIYPIQAESRNQGTRESCKDWHSFNFVLLPQSMDSDNRAHNYLFLIVLARKIGLLQVVVSDVDACNWNSNHPVHPVSYPQPITITSIPY